MPSLTEYSYIVASQMAQLKEDAIVAMLDHCFSDHDLHWNELMVVNKVRLEIAQYGAETYFVCDKPMLKIGRVETDVIISGQSVKCLFKQKIEELYKND